MRQLIYKDSLGQFSRDAFSEGDPLYDKGTSSHTLSKFFYSLNRFDLMGLHPDEAGITTTIYYSDRLTGAALKAKVGVTEVTIEAHGLENAIKQTSQFILKYLPGRARSTQTS